MTPEQLDALDRYIATEIMGWAREEPRPYTRTGTERGPEWWRKPSGETVMYGTGFHPTRDRDQAMLVFERCEWMSLKHNVLGGYEAGELSHGEWLGGEAEADTPALAISLAAARKHGWTGLHE